MKKLLLAAASLGAVISTPALAAAPSATYDVTASVPQSCNAGSNGTISFSTLTLNSDGTVASGQSASSTGTAVYCNGAAATLTLSTGNTITNSAYTADAGGFTKTLTFTTTAKIGSGATLNEGTTTIGAVAGNLVVTASSINGLSGARPYAGDYTGSLTVTLTPGA
ncbi:hypothetical protein [Novosphingobium cyanobacteriorum]|uniref:Spore coat protein U domain-containing protein n=1 Tax=Novosphingobium cyanobacteriorum TaxID=3024215 RepID=A0ABT6CMB1_9SPHN|nr:hypothetical protein [Novosphingobium cyanobacteriorum]MDF8335051.1 hypothetical protein [Novosphingobium cyanobacteriorum]